MNRIFHSKNQTNSNNFMASPTGRQVSFPRRHSSTNMDHLALANESNHSFHLEADPSLSTLSDDHIKMMEDLYKDQTPTTLFVAPDCGLQLALNLNVSHSQEFGMDYRIKNIHDFPLTSKPKTVRGWMSPMHDLSELPGDQKSNVAVPEEAMFFAYVYPPKHLADHIDWEKVEAKIISLRNNEGPKGATDDDYTWAMPFSAIFGAFAYYDESFKLIQVNVITPNETKYRIPFGGPFLTLDIYEEIHDLNRYQPLYFDALREVGYNGVAWVDPGNTDYIDKSVKGQENLENIFGGFLFFRYDNSAVLLLAGQTMTNPFGICHILRDAFRILKHDIKTPTLTMTCPRNQGREEFETHDIAKNGSMEHLQYVLSQNPMSHSRLLITRDSYGWTPLHYACCYQSRNPEFIKYLIEYGPDAVFVKSKNDMLPLHVACLNDPSVEVIEILLNADKQKQTLMAPSKHHGMLPIHLACSYTKTTVDVVMALIQGNEQDTHKAQAKRPSLAYRGKLGWTALHTCIASNQEHEMIEAVLRKSDIDFSINTQFPALYERVNGILPLQLACLKGSRVETVKMLITADPGRKTFYDVLDLCEEYKLQNTTILHIALANSSPDVIKLLLTMEVKSRCKLSRTVTNLHNIQEQFEGMIPMHVACKRDDLDSEMIDTMLRLRRKSVFDLDDRGNTPLHLVCMNKGVSEDIINMLLESEKDQNMNERLRKANTGIIEADEFDINIFADNPKKKKKSAKEEKVLTSAARMGNNDGHTPLFLATHSAATNVHRLLEPEYLALSGLGDEEKDLLFDLVVANDKFTLELVNNLAQFQYFVFIMLELVLNILTTAIFIMVSSTVFNNAGSVEGNVEGSVEIWHIVVLSSCILFFFSREVIQFMGSSTAADYFFDGWNMIELSSLAFLSLNVYQLTHNYIDSAADVNSNLFMISGALLIIQFILIVRTSFLPFARFVAGLLSILAELIPFTIVSAMFLLAFTYAFQLSGNREEECPSFGDCLYWTLEGFFYGVDGFNATPLTDILFGVLAVVMLLNVVIAIVSNAWDDAEETTRLIFWQSRVDVLFQYRKLFRRHHDLLNRLNSGNQDFAPLQTGSVVMTTVNFVKNIFHFLLGLPTMGILWPYSLRVKILSAGMGDIESDKEES